MKSRSICCCSLRETPLAGDEIEHGDHHRGHAEYANIRRGRHWHWYAVLLRIPQHEQTQCLLRGSDRLARAAMDRPVISITCGVIDRQRHSIISREICRCLEHTLAEAGDIRAAAAPFSGPEPGSAPGPGRPVCGAGCGRSAISAGRRANSTPAALRGQAVPSR
jgi:hypothetical protein